MAFRMISTRRLAAGPGSKLPRGGQGPGREAVGEAAEKGAEGTVTVEKGVGRRGEGRMLESMG